MHCGTPCIEQTSPPWGEQDILRYRYFICLLTFLTPSNIKWSCCLDHFHSHSLRNEADDNVVAAGRCRLCQLLSPNPHLQVHMLGRDVLWYHDLDLWPMPLTFKLNLDILSLDMHAKVQVCMSGHSARIVRRTKRHTNTPTDRHTMSKLFHPPLTRGVTIVTVNRLWLSKTYLHLTIQEWSTTSKLSSMSISLWCNRRW